MKKLAIFGAGGFGKEVAMLVEQINATTPTWDLIGFFDDGVPNNTEVNGYSCLGGVNALNQTDQNIGIVIAIADPNIKTKIYGKINNPAVYYPSLIHPNVQMGAKEYVTIGEGCIITAGNLITVNIAIGKHVILNLGCTVGHDVLLGDFSSVMPSVNI